MVSYAKFSEDRSHRFLLVRKWDKGDSICFVMLNPSTADEQKNDPTVARCISFAKATGHAGVEIVNLFSFRSPSPKELVKAEVRNMLENDEFVFSSAAKCKAIVVAWGIVGKLDSRGEEVLTKLKELFPDKVFCLGNNKDGTPKHPLYLPKPFMAKKIS